MYAVTVVALEELEAGMLTSLITPGITTLNPVGQGSAKLELPSQPTKGKVSLVGIAVLVVLGLIAAVLAALVFGSSSGSLTSLASAQPPGAEPSPEPVHPGSRPSLPPPPAPPPHKYDAQLRGHCVHLQCPLFRGCSEGRCAVGNQLAVNGTKYCTGSWRHCLICKRQSCGMQELANDCQAQKNSVNGKFLAARWSGTTSPIPQNCGHCSTAPVLYGAASQAMCQAYCDDEPRCVGYTYDFGKPSLPGSDEEGGKGLGNCYVFGHNISENTLTQRRAAGCTTKATPGLSAWRSQQNADCPAMPWNPVGNHGGDSPATFQKWFPNDVGSQRQRWMRAKYGYVPELVTSWDGAGFTNFIRGKDAGETYQERNKPSRLTWVRYAPVTSRCCSGPAWAGCCSGGMRPPQNITPVTGHDYMILLSGHSGDSSPGDTGYLTSPVPTPLLKNCRGTAEDSSESSRSCLRSGYKRVQNNPTLFYRRISGNDPSRLLTRIKFHYFMYSETLGTSMGTLAVEARVNNVWQGVWFKTERRQNSPTTWRFVDIALPAPGATQIRFVGVKGPGSARCCNGLSIMTCCNGIGFDSVEVTSGVLPRNAANLWREEWKSRFVPFSDSITTTQAEWWSLGSVCKLVRGAGDDWCNTSYVGGTCMPACDAITKCNGHGTCDGYGNCNCNSGWAGVVCNKTVPHIYGPAMTGQCVVYNFTQVSKKVYKSYKDDLVVHPRMGLGDARVSPAVVMHTQRYIGASVATQAACQARCDDQPFCTGYNYLPFRWQCYVWFNVTITGYSSQDALRAGCPRGRTYSSTNNPHCTYAGSYLKTYGVDLKEAEGICVPVSSGSG
jgi:hypothetical protein